MAKSKETKADDNRRTSNLRSAVFDYRHQSGADREFVDVVWSGLRHQDAPPEGHDYPTRDR
ncbi:hypothetical protein ACEYXF_41180 [Streptomyces asiaticus]|uniref:hypothetical protein n=1 Tax=Streptomyces asiaticus TaxID=114695 RepID=UPI0039BE62A6